MAKENWVKRLKRKSHELLRGEKAYIGKKRQDEMKLARMLKKHEAKKSNTGQGKPKQREAPKTAPAKPKAIWKTQGEMAQAENLGSELKKLRKKGKGYK